MTGGALPAARDREDGSIVALVGLLLAVATLVLVLVLDLTAYLVAASRAQAAADAAALAAVTVSDPRGRTPGDPSAAAERLAAAADAEVESCACRAGARHVEVRVSVAVHAVLVTRLAGRRVTAVAEAELRRDRRTLDRAAGEPLASSVVGVSDPSRPVRRRAPAGPTTERRPRTHEETRR